ncbi:MAG: hypothetical protein AMJ78_03770 [Omnitrophica WOR_2 bacterium SM23_29]|nr:MAG: hypothetical protein AMJ78_03770 [Omnitrophica WOR_2 bacterium SM23_29]
MKTITGSVTAPQGFIANGVKSGIKKGKLDLALIVSKVPALAAGVFTTNELKAAPLKVSKAHIKNGRAQAIVINSGNANCLTGKSGLKAAIDIAKAISKSLWISEDDVLVASTGLIGKPLPTGKIKSAIAKLVKGLSKAKELKAAQAILTTDTRPKRIAVAINIGKKTVKLGGIAKGAGMICPNMATMLCFLTTDANIGLRALRRSLRDSVESSFNTITVDGDMSTNDMVLILANSLAGGPEIRYLSREHRIFSDALNYVTSYLAKEIVRGGEGATKFIEVNVKGSRSLSDAKRMAKQIANSNLVKTAIAGEDPNIGRIASAAGASGVKFDESKLDIYLNRIKIVDGGNVIDKVRPKIRRSLRKREIIITLDLNCGSNSAASWTCDLTEEYIKINARYN